MRFPVFLKLANNHKFFRINSLNDFEEITLIGEHVQYFHFHAKIYPDFLLINDMLENRNGHWVESTKEEFNLHLSKVPA